MSKTIFFFFFLLLISCNSIKENIGIALNAKDGAIIRTTNSTYIIQDKLAWNDSILNKKIYFKYKIIESGYVSKENLTNEHGLHKQGREGNNIIIKLIDTKIEK